MHLMYIIFFMPLPPLLFGLLHYTLKEPPGQIIIILLNHHKKYNFYSIEFERKITISHNYIIIILIVVTSLFGIGINVNVVMILLVFNCRPARCHNAIRTVNTRFFFNMVILFYQKTTLNAHLMPMRWLRQKNSRPGVRFIATHKINVGRYNTPTCRNYVDSGRRDGWLLSRVSRTIA